MATRSTTGAVTNDRAPVRTAALAVSIVFLLVGVLGFIPGVTTDYGDMSFAGHHSGAHLLGVFQVSILHNIVHLLFGAAGLLMGRTAVQSRYFLLGGGVLYLVIWLYGLLIDQASGANVIPVNTADNWLHAVLGVAMIVLGFVLGRDMTRTERRG